MIDEAIDMITGLPHAVPGTGWLPNKNPDHDLVVHTLEQER
jgi:hypothetical protein